MSNVTSKPSGYQMGISTSRSTSECAEVTQGSTLTASQNQGPAKFGVSQARSPGQFQRTKVSKVSLGGAVIGSPLVSISLNPVSDGYAGTIWYFEPENLNINILT